ncbi:MAG: hypothetical protein JXB15_00420 [Anaerolineales bacterium]|nr:hypothetical protein [Anaerolineales bacterium]
MALRVERRQEPLLAVLALYFYPLHGKRLKEVKEALAQIGETEQAE